MASNPVVADCRSRQSGLTNPFERRAGVFLVGCPKAVFGDPILIGMGEGIQERPVPPAGRICTAWLSESSQ